MITKKQLETTVFICLSNFRGIKLDSQVLYLTLQVTNPWEVIIYSLVTNYTAKNYVCVPFIQLDLRLSSIHVLLPPDT